MKNGQCPKCGAKAVYSGAQIAHKAGGLPGLANAIPIAGNIMFGFSKAVLDNYVCANCGYVESYISDPAKLQDIVANWPQVQFSEGNE